MIGAGTPLALLTGVFVTLGILLLTANLWVALFFGAASLASSMLLIIAATHIAASLDKIAPKK